MDAILDNRKHNCLALPASDRAKPAAVLGILILVFMASMIVAACGKPPALINRYVLDYPPPAVGRLAPLDTGITVELFAVAEALNRPEMVYKVNPYKTGTYQYNRWRTDPAYLVTDYLTRDLRDSRLFKAVFPYERSGQARFRLEGAVADFQEDDLPGPWMATLTLNVTLLDGDKENVADKVVFQRRYQAQEPMPAKTPQGLAEAMSTAMQRVSKQIIDDVYRAAKARLGTDSG